MFAPDARLDTSFDSAMYAPRGGTATSEHSSVEFFSEFQTLLSAELATTRFVHPSVFIAKLVKQRCFKMIRMRVPISFSPFFLGSREQLDRAVTTQLAANLFRFKHEMGGMPLAHTQFELVGRSPLMLPVACPLCARALALCLVAARC